MACTPQALSKASLQVLREVVEAVKPFSKVLLEFLAQDLFENYEKTVKHMFGYDSLYSLVLQDCSHLELKAKSVRQALLVLIPSVITFLQNCIELANYGIEEYVPPEQSTWWYQLLSWLVPGPSEREKFMTQFGQKIK